MAKMKRALIKNGKYIQPQHESIDFQQLRASNDSYSMNYQSMKMRHQSNMVAASMIPSRGNVYDIKIKTKKKGRQSKSRPKTANNNLRYSQQAYNTIDLNKIGPTYNMKPYKIQKGLSKIINS